MGPRLNCPTRGTAGIKALAYWEQALALDPRNMELLTHAAWTYAMLRQFPAALKLYDRALDITPDDPDVMASKASIYQAQGNLQASRQVTIRNNRAETFWRLSSQRRSLQLRLERNYGEAIRLLQARLAQFPSASEFERPDQLAACFHAAPCRRYGWGKDYR